MGEIANKYVLQVVNKAAEMEDNYPTCDIALDGVQLKIFVDSCSSYTLNDYDILQEKFQGKSKLAVGTQNAALARDTVPCAGSLLSLLGENLAVGAGGHSSL